MGIEDIQISEELETNAPSIKYRGDEGPKSPQEIEQMMMAQLEEEYLKYVDEMIEMGKEPMSMQQFMNQAMAEGQMAGGNPLPQDPTKPVNPFQPKPTGPVLPDRQMAAYGGIMGIDGRRRYGIGSKIKERFRKILPNEIAQIAETAAPFVAPFNPLLAGAMSAVGGFDRTGRIGSSLKSGLMNYAMGQGARYLGGADFQGGFDPRGGFTQGTAGTGKFSQYFSKPTGDGGIKNLFDRPTEKVTFNNSGMTKDNKFSKITEGTLSDPKEKLDFIKDTKASNLSLLDKAKDFAMNNKLATFLLAKEGLDLFGNTPEETGKMDRGESLDIEGIRAEVIEAMKDETGEKLAALREKYSFLGRQDTKDISNMAMGGRAGFAEGGGIMDLGGMEKDYRAEGGFVPIGKAEKADDVPARLSVNEFVFTADAVRNAGGGDIDRGAEVMENMMKNLEAGGQVSEESQGMAGAQQMFETSQRLSEVI